MSNTKSAMQMGARFQGMSKAAIKKAQAKIEANKQRMLEALEHHQALTIHYTDGNGEETDRVIVPAFVGPDFVNAWCRTRKAMRKFYFDRMTIEGGAGIMRQTDIIPFNMLVQERARAQKKAQQAEQRAQVENGAGI